MNVAAMNVALDEDFHVHSTFSDGASTLAENVRAARQRGLRTVCLVDHVRRDTRWLPEFTAAVDEHRGQPGLRVLAGVEAKILDTAGHLDLPPGLQTLGGIDLVLIADHQFPADNGPVHPDELRAALEFGSITSAEAIERLCEATAQAATAQAATAQAATAQAGMGAAPNARPLLAHLFSLLPKIGLDEAMVPDALLTDLAKRVAHAGVMVEVNEKWSCPSARTVAAMAHAGASLVAGSDSHHCRDIGVYHSVSQTVRAAGV